MRSRIVVNDLTKCLSVWVLGCVSVGQESLLSTQRRSVSLPHQHSHSRIERRHQIKSVTRLYSNNPSQHSTTQLPTQHNSQPNTTLNPTQLSTQSLHFIPIQSNRAIPSRPKCMLLTVVCAEIRFSGHRRSWSLYVAGPRSTWLSLSTSLSATVSFLASESCDPES